MTSQRDPPHTSNKRGLASVRAVRQPLIHVGAGLAHLRDRRGREGSQVPGSGSGSNEGYLMERPVPAVRVPKAHIVKELQQGVCAPLSLIKTESFHHMLISKDVHFATIFNQTLIAKKLF